MFLGWRQKKYKKVIPSKSTYPFYVNDCVGENWLCFAASLDFPIPFHSTAPLHAFTYTYKIQEVVSIKPILRATFFFNKISFCIIDKFCKDCTWHMKHSNSCDFSCDQLDGNWIKRHVQMLLKNSIYVIQHLIFRIFENHSTIVENLVFIVTLNVA